MNPARFAERKAARSLSMYVHWQENFNAMPFSCEAEFDVPPITLPPSRR